MLPCYKGIMKTDYPNPLAFQKTLPAPFNGLKKKQAKLHLQKFIYKRVTVERIKERECDVS